MRSKLHGYEFWKSIGSPKYVCAPMVGQSDLPFRLLNEKIGCQLRYSPMINSEMYMKSKPKPTQTEKIKKYRDSHFRTCQEDRPLFAQFSGNDPQHMIQAARDFEDDVDAIDINFGCPQNIAKKGNYGSYLLDQPEIVYSLISALHKELKVPVTAKIRILKDDVEGTLKLAKLIQEAGASVLTVHGRSREEKLGLTQKCDWDIIKKIKSQLSIPVIANGGIYNFNDVQKCIEYTGCDAVMSCEGLLEYPALFSGNNEIDVDELALEYLEISKINPPCQIHFIKGHLCKLFFRSMETEKELFLELNKAKTIEQYQNVALKFKEIRTNMPVLEKRGYYFRWWSNNMLIQQQANSGNIGTAQIISSVGNFKQSQINEQVKAKIICKEGEQNQIMLGLKRDRTLSQDQESVKEALDIK